MPGLTSPRGSLASSVTWTRARPSLLHPTANDSACEKIDRGRLPRWMRYVVWISQSPDHWPSSIVRSGDGIARRHQPEIGTSCGRTTVTQTELARRSILVRSDPLGGKTVHARKPRTTLEQCRYV